MGVFPSGQWGQTVNLLLSASVVRIHPRPPRTPVSNGYRSFCFICLAKGAARVDSNSCGAVAEDSAKTAQWAVFSSAARAIHPRPPKNRNVSKYAAVFIYNSDIFTSPACQSSCARILFCTISPAGVRARVRPSKVAYPTRTQFCTKASCAVENCLPYRAL